MIRGIINFFQHEEEENYYKPVAVGNFWSNNYIEYKSYSDIKKNHNMNLMIKQMRLKFFNNIFLDKKLGWVESYGFNIYLCSIIIP